MQGTHAPRAVGTIGRAVMLSDCMIRLGSLFVEQDSMG